VNNNPLEGDPKFGELEFKTSGSIGTTGTYIYTETITDFKISGVENIEISMDIPEYLSSEIVGC
jgi:negative regulator of replication initiation